MKLQELPIASEVTVQISWGNSNLDFTTNIKEIAWDSIIIPSFFYNGAPLPLNITTYGTICCNVYYVDVFTGKRFSWKNVTVETKSREQGPVYCIKTSTYNQHAALSERRNNTRIRVQVPGYLTKVGQNQLYLSIHIFDVSDNGISFLAPLDYEPSSSLVSIEFKDTANKQMMEVSTDARIVRNVRQESNRLFGCEISHPSREYLMYSFLKRLEEQQLGKKKLEENS